jgi:hypothetical protein
LLISSEGSATSGGGAGGGDARCTGRRGRLPHIFAAEFDDAVFEAAVGRNFRFEPLLIFHGGDGVVDAEDLVIAGDDFAGAAGFGVVEQDEILDQVKEAVLGKHAVEEDLGFHAAFFLLFVALPFGEVLPLAGDGAVAGAVAVTDDEESVVMEGVIDAGLAEVVGQVVVVARPHVEIDSLELDEHQGEAVDETDQIGPAVVVGDTEALDFEFADGEEAVVGGAVWAGAVLEVEDLGAGVLGLAGGIAPINGDAVADEVVEFAVVLDERAGEVHPGQFFDGLLAG